MIGVWNFLRGTIRVTLCGPETEQLLNRCAKAGLPIWDVQRDEAFVLSLCVTRRVYPALLALAGRCGCEITKQVQRGLPYLIKPFRRRYAVLLGATLCLLSILFLSRFLLVFEIEGNETVTDAEILSVMRQHGVHLGVYGPGIDRRSLSHKVLMDMEELSFFSLNLQGTRAQVIVRESVPKPTLLDEKSCVDVVSEASGIITRIEHIEGQLLCAVGDTVLEGECLISGVVDIPEAEYSDADLGLSYHHAQGRIYARTWRTLTAKIPLTAEIKCPTGEETTRFALNLMGKRVKFYGNGGISFDKYDKITATKAWTLSDGATLPLSLERERYRAYEMQEVALDHDAAETLLRERLQQTLAAAVGEQAEVLRSDFVTRLVDGWMEVTLLAECNEEIGKTVPAQHLPQETTKE